MKDPECKQGLDNIKLRFKDMITKFGTAGKALKGSWKSVWTENGRRHLKETIMQAVRAAIELFKALVKFIWSCDATQPLVLMIGMIAVALVINQIIVLTGWAVLPILIKLIGMLMELVFGIPFLIKVIVKLYENVMRMTSGNCQKQCKLDLITGGAELVGFFINIVILSGMNKVITFTKASKSGKTVAGAGKVKGLLGRIKLHPEMADDLTKLKHAMGRRKGATVKIGPNKGIIDGTPPKSPKGQLKGKGTVDAPMTNADSKMALNKGEFQQNMMTGGPLDDINPNAAGSFHGGQYNVVKLEEDLILYRAGDSTGRNGGKMGSYFSRTPPKTRAQVRTSSAVKTEWVDGAGKVTGVSKLDQVVEVRIPKGTTIFEGPIASMGGKHHGIGGNQIFIDKPWEIPGVEDGAKVIKKWSGNAAGGSLSDAVHATRQDAGLTARTAKTSVNSVRAADAAAATRRSSAGDQVGVGEKTAGQWTDQHVARCTSISGKCVDVNFVDTEKQCSGGVKSGKCPGSANIKCCITGGLTVPF
jgi:hypothetical protein